MSQDDRLSKELLTWLIQGQVLILNLTQHPDEDLNFYDLKIVEQFELVGHPVYLVVCVDVLPTQGTPSMNYIMSLKHLQHPYLRQLIFVGIKTNPVGRFIISALAKLKGLQLKTFDTLPDALNYLNRMQMEAEND